MEFFRQEYWQLFLLQGIFPTLGSNLGLPLCRPMLYHQSHHRSHPPLKGRACCKKEPSKNNCSVDYRGSLGPTTSSWPVGGYIWRGLMVDQLVVLKWWGLCAPVWLLPYGGLSEGWNLLSRCYLKIKNGIVFNHFWHCHPTSPLPICLFNKGMEIGINHVVMVS